MSAGTATPASRDTNAHSRYRQYIERLSFAHRDRAVLVRIADALGYGTAVEQRYTTMTAGS